MTNESMRSSANVFEVVSRGSSVNNTKSKQIQTGSTYCPCVQIKGADKDGPEQ